MVEGNGLENRRTGNGTQGSNPCLSAIYCFQLIFWKGGRVVECAPLLRVCTLLGYRGFESLSFRHYCLRLFQNLGPVAQGLEQLAHNQLVAGSNPARPTIKNVVTLGNIRENKKSLKKVLTSTY